MTRGVKTLSCAVKIVAGFFVVLPLITCQPFEEAAADCSSGQILVPNPYNCGQYYHCSYGLPLLRSCPIGLYFNPLTLNCDWPFAVDVSLCSRTPEIPEDKNGTAADILFLREVGEWSEPIDDAESTAVCPEGTVPIDCACSSPGTCNGALITNRNCVAYNAGSRNRQQAIATCLTELTTSEFQWVDNPSWGQNPQVTCPKGYHVIKCNLHNLSSQRQYVHPVMNVAANRCETDKECIYGANCKIQAVCRTDDE